MDDDKLTELKNQVQYLTDDSSKVNTRKKQKDLEKALDTFNNYNLHKKYNNKIKKQKIELVKLDNEVKSLKNIIKISKNHFNNKKTEETDLNQKTEETDLNQKSEQNDLNQKTEETDLNQKSEQNDLNQKTEETDLNEKDDDILKSLNSLIGGSKLNYYDYIPFLNDYYFDLFNNNYDYNSLLLYSVYHLLSIIEVIILFMIVNNGISLKLIYIIIFYIIIKLKFNTIKLKKNIKNNKEINLDILKNTLINPNSNIDKNKIYDKISLVLKYYKELLSSENYKKLFYFKLGFIFLYILLFSIIFYNTECIITSIIIFVMIFLILPNRVILINIMDNNLRYKSLWEYSKYIEIFIVFIICYKIVRIYSNKYTSNLDFINILRLIISEIKKNFLKIDNNNILVKEFNNLFIK